MNISEKLTLKHLEQILMNSYKKGRESEDMEIKQMIDDIKEQIMSAIESSN